MAGDSQIMENIEEKSSNILAYETLRQNISTDLPIKLKKKFSNMSYMSGKSLLVEPIFRVLKQATGRQKPWSLLLMIQNNSTLVSLSINHSSKFMQFCSTFSNRCLLQEWYVKFFSGSKFVHFLLFFLIFFCFWQILL